MEAWVEEGTSAAHLPFKNLATRHRLSLASLPPDLFPPSSSHAGPLWTDEARHRVAAVVSWDGGQSSPAALSGLGLWRSSSSSSTPFRCANYSMLGMRPLPLTNPACIHRSLAARAAFAGFARDESIACVVLPGFRLATTGNVVPDEVVLGEGRGLLAGNAVIFTSLADLKAAGNGGDFVSFQYVARTAAPSGRPSERAQPATRSAACTAFGLPTGTFSCFSPHLASLIDAAITALPPSYQCALDTRRTHQEVALLSQEGRLGEVGSSVRRQWASGRGRLPILLTGAWRHVAGGRLSSANALSALLKIVTLADLAAPLSAPLDPISRLVRYDAITSTSSLASSPWADVIEYAACQRAQSVRDLDDETTGLLATPLTPASALARRAALIPPAVLAEDLTALTRWLARPDRPSLASAKLTQFDLSGSPPISADDFQDAVLAPSLGLARAVGAKVVALPPLPVPWSSHVGEEVLRQHFADHADLVPSSMAGLLVGPLSNVSNNKLLISHAARRTNTLQRPTRYPASIDLLHSSTHRSAVYALEHALGLALGTARKPVTPPTTLYMPAALSPIQHARLQEFAAGAHDILFTF